MRVLWLHVPFGPVRVTVPLLMGRPGGLVAALVLSTVTALVVALALELRRNH